MVGFASVGLGGFCLALSSEVIGLNAVFMTARTPADIPEDLFLAHAFSQT